MPASTRPHRAGVPPIDPSAQAPMPLRPVQAKARRLAAATRVEPRSQAWPQAAMSSTSVIRKSAGISTHRMPPSRALWILPGVDMPDDKRQRQLCEAVPDEPTRIFTRFRGERGDDLLHIFHLRRESWAAVARTLKPSARRGHPRRVAVEEPPC